MRDYEYDPKTIEAERKEREKLEKDLKKQFVSVKSVCVHVHVHVSVTKSRAQV